MDHQTILVEYGTERIKQNLLTFPVLIREQKTRVAKTRQELKEAEQIKGEIEACLVAEIAAEVNENTGKPKFPNAEARAAELALRKKMNTEYQKACRTARQAEWDANEAQADLEKLWDEFKAWRYIADLTSRELAFLASEINEDQKETTKEPF